MKKAKILGYHKLFNLFMWIMLSGKQYRQYKAELLEKDKKEFCPDRNGSNGKVTPALNDCCISGSNL